MSRLIEVQDVEGLPPGLTLGVGDLLWLPASGVGIGGGAPEVVQVLGPFVQAVMGAGGQVVSPAGPPNTVLLLARQPGRASLEIVTGDPWRGASMVTRMVTVEP